MTRYGSAGQLRNEEQMELLAVNIAKPRDLEIGKEVYPTGIFKEPTEAVVHVNELGIEGDHIADLEHHGGVDQAVYLYSREDYVWWEKELGRSLPAGQFGENLTVSSYGTPDIRIGDRFHIGDVLLEVAFVRIPCAKFGAKMGDSGFPKRFSQALRPGVYTRVIQTGTVKAGDQITLHRSADNHPTAAEVFQTYLSRGKDKTLVERCLASPMSSRMKTYYRQWLDT